MLFTARVIPSVLLGIIGYVSWIVTHTVVGESFWADGYYEKTIVIAKMAFCLGNRGWPYSSSFCDGDHMLTVHPIQSSNTSTQVSLVTKTLEPVSPC